MSPGLSSPDGTTAPEIYRKHVARIEELETENERLNKDFADSERRRKKAEDELEELREADSPTRESGGASDEVEKLVSVCPPLPTHLRFSTMLTLKIL